MIARVIGIEGLFFGCGRLPDNNLKAAFSAITSAAVGIAGLLSYTSHLIFRRSNARHAPYRSLCMPG